MKQSLIVSMMVVTSACGITASPVKVPVIEDTAFAQALMVDLSASTKLDNGEYIRDLVVGTGAEVEIGQSLKAAYTGWLADGTQFDTGSSTFRYGAGDVIGGWDQGLGGMKGGGTRQLIVPPALGYGSRGAGGVIPPNSILVFQVALP